MESGEMLKLCEFDCTSRLPDSVVEQRGMLNNCEVDYISQLPDSVVHHIYSFLHARDVASTSVLSKTWNKCWCRYPYAVFHFIYNSYYPTEQNKQDFLDLIERAVRGRIGGEFHLQRFQMYIEFSDLSLLEPYLDQWMSIAIGKGVSELALRVEITLSGGLRFYYSVPQVVLLAECLKVLSLSGCTFGSGFHVRLPQLMKFSLHCSEFEDELSFQVLMSGFRKIEYVKISDSKLMCKKTLSLMNLPMLKHFEYLRCEHLKNNEFYTPKDVENVEIYATNLQTFAFGSAAGRWPQTYDLNSCTSLKELRFVGSGLSLKYPEPLIFQLPCLEILEFDDFCTGPDDLVIASRMLKRLAFRNCRALHITADTPNLQYLEICYSRTLFIPVNVSTILTVHLIFNGQSIEWLIRLRNFLSTSCSLIDLKLVIYHKSDKWMIIHERLSEISFPSFYHFMDKNYICISSKSYTDLMNELIPKAYPEHVYLIHTRNEFVKGMLEKIKDVSRNPNSQGTLFGFKVITRADVEEDCVDPVTSYFMKKYSIPPYMESVLSLDWRMRGDVPGSRKVLL